MEDFENKRFESLVSPSDEPLVEGGLISLDELAHTQVVRSEFMSPKYRPSLTLNYDSIVFNANCVRLFMDTHFVQLLIDRTKMRIIVLPCDEYTKDALKWSKEKDDKFQPRSSICRIFGIKIYELMNWIPENRYRVQAVYQELSGQRLLVFNLSECEMVVPELVTLGNGKTARKSKRYYPQEWKDTFGMTYLEHKESYHVDINAHYLLSNTKDGTQSDYQMAERARELSPTEIITRQYSSPYGNANKERSQED